MLNEKVVFSWRSEIAVKKYVFPFTRSHGPPWERRERRSCVSFSESKKSYDRPGVLPLDGYIRGLCPRELNHGIIRSFAEG
jgi:hypothetical protein